MHVCELRCIGVLICVCSCSHRHFSKLSIQLHAVVSFPNRNLVGGTCRVCVCLMKSDTQGPMCSQQPTSTSGSLHTGLAKPGVFGEIQCGLESLKQWFLPCSKEEEADPWTLPTECLSRLKAKSSSAMPSQHLSGQHGQTDRESQWGVSGSPSIHLEQLWLGSAKL